MSVRDLRHFAGGVGFIRRRRGARHELQVYVASAASLADVGARRSERDEHYDLHSAELVVEVRGGHKRFFYQRFASAPYAFEHCLRAFQDFKDQRDEEEEPADNRLLETSRRLLRLLLSLGFRIFNASVCAIVVVIVRVESPGIPGKALAPALGISLHVLHIGVRSCGRNSRYNAAVFSGDPRNEHTWAQRVLQHRRVGLPQRVLQHRRVGLPRCLCRVRMHTHLV